MRLENPSAAKARTAAHRFRLGSAAPVAVVSCVLALFLTGCAASQDEAATTPAASTAGPSEPTQEAAASPTAEPKLERPVQIDVAQSGGVVTPPPSRVEVPLGSEVVLRVGSDVADEIHVHGYELEDDVAAGGTVTFEFVADQSGLFEVETHETELLLLQLQVA